MVESEPPHTPPNASATKSVAGINYYILSLMFGGIILFAVANSYEPQINTQADFFEISLWVSQWVAGIFGLLVARKYWGSRVFGRAYLALGIGFLLWGVGSATYTILNILGDPLPYPGLPDVFFIPYFLLLTFHLVTCTRYFKKRFSIRDKLTLVLLPVIINVIYVFALLFPVGIPGSVPDLLSHQIIIGHQTFKLVPIESVTGDYQQILVSNVSYALVPLEPSSTIYPQLPQSNSSVDLIPLALSHLSLGEVATIDLEFWPPFLAGLFYNAITTINLAWAILGMTVFRGSLLGIAWGLLLVGIAINATADIVYDFTTIYYYDRTNPTIPLWVFGSMIISYALYIHRKTL